LQCAAIFTTEEKIDLSQVWQVAGKHGMLPFERDRLFLSLHRSLQHRVSARQDAAALTQTVIDKLLKQKITGPISNRTIIQHVQVALNRFDSAASVHYQAFHKI
jgi:transcriptional regulator NrdR family protein